jgi:leucyl-tRNA synthetase
VWDLAMDDGAVDVARGGATARELERASHAALERVTEDMQTFSFNTAIAALMALRNTLKESRGQVAPDEWNESIRLLLLMLAPMAPHITEELWARRGWPFSIHQQAWPEADHELAAPDTVEIGVQVGGKVRARIVLPADASEEQAVAVALADPGVQRALGGREPARVVYVPGRLVSLVL